jgi:hypothetical protein
MKAGSTNEALVAVILTRALLSLRRDATCLPRDLRR